MIGLLQRVSHAEVRVAGTQIAAINTGGYRVFPDAEGKMNLCLKDVGGGLLLVPQFTLAADTRSGLRAGFSHAASPAAGNHLFDYLVSQAQQHHEPVACGQFGADMQVSLVNDGPVTFWLET